MAADPIDGGGKIEARVDRLYWITDDQGKRIGRLEDMNLVRFTTEVEMGMKGLKAEVRHLSEVVAAANLPAMRKDFGEMKNKVNQLWDSETAESGHDKKKGDAIARILMPLVALSGVAVALAALLNQ